jgi:hypothetical protein
LVALFTLTSLFCQPVGSVRDSILKACQFGPGTTGFDFLRIGLAARPIGMGESFVAVSDDISAAYWNPAGLGDLSKKQIMFMTSRWLMDMNYHYVGYASPWGDSTLGMNLGMFSFGDIAAYDQGGAYVGNFSGYDGFATLSWAKKINYSLLAGVNLKYISEKLGDYSASGLALDLGTTYYTQVDGLAVGANLQNIGSNFKFISEDTPLPLNLKLGLAYDRHFDSDQMLITSDLNLPSQQSSTWGLGLEYTLRRFLSLRTGFKLLGGDGIHVPGFGLAHGCFSAGHCL